MDSGRSDGWAKSARAWITELGERGDYNREFVLDSPMIARVQRRKYRMALDVGCGEGRFCRMLRSSGIQTVGIDPTEAFIEHAIRKDPAGDYQLGCAERLAFPDGLFDLVICYVSLVNILDIGRAIREISRVLQPGGTLLIANLNSFVTAGFPDGWIERADGTSSFDIDRYSEVRAEWVSWADIRVQNWHRPLSAYMSLLLEQGLELRHFSEPLPGGGDPTQAERFRRVPYFLIMEWQKPLLAR
ncbi:MAG: class I SAM-dependent methyltransferase [Rhodospirillaceae bacterium]|nr:class I SAM-dependent methyltransferase [Rhodospirillaceae bacterium]